MNETVFLEFINPELYIIAVFLYAVGLFLKKNTKFKDEWCIPYILLGLSIIFTTVYTVFVLNKPFTIGAIVTSIINGTFIAAIAVFGNELFKQLKIKKKEDERRE